ncbi:9906_t:CDS:2, partial [Diversispora eburnea]
NEFEDWNSAEKHVEKYANEVSFEVVKRQLEKNKRGEIVRRTFECKNSHQYCAKKKADVEDTRECESIKMNCPWKVNLGLASNIIHVTSMCKEHNHPLFENLENRNIASNCHLTSEMLEEIEFLTYEKLMKLQREEHDWFVEAKLESEDNHLTDADASMITAIYETLPSTKHNYCIWHLRKNIEKNLKGKLHKKYNNFVKKWNKCRNSFSEDEFQKQWQELLTNYSEARKYLEWALETDVTISLPNVIGRYFKRIDSIIKKYLIPQVLKMQHCQMNESLLYYVKKIENWKIHEIYDFKENTNNITLDNDDEEKKQSDEEQNQSINEEEQKQFFDKEQEQFFDEEEQERFFDKEEKQTQFDNESSNVDNGQDQSDNDERDQFDNNKQDQSDDDEQNQSDNESSTNHLCTCMWLVTWGLVCRHFFSIMFNLDKAMFYIGLISSRWYNDVTFNPQKEFAITIRSKESETDDKSIYEHQIRTNFDILNEFRNTQLFSETVRANLSHKAKYNLGFGYAKQAIGLALEMGYEDELNMILRNWISEKKRERQPECTSNKENLPNISNPYQTRTKGTSKKV